MPTTPRELVYLRLITLSDYEQHPWPRCECPAFEEIFRNPLDSPQWIQSCQN